jgi:hypothetical protein
LALFGRRPSECVERPSFRRPKTCTTTCTTPAQQRTHALQQDALVFGFALEAMAAGSVQ